MDGTHGETAEFGVCGTQQMRIRGSRATAMTTSSSAYSREDSLSTHLLYKASVHCWRLTSRAAKAELSLAMRSGLVMAGASPPQKYVRSTSAHDPRSVVRGFGAAHACNHLERSPAKARNEVWSPGGTWANTPSLLSAKPDAKQSQKHAPEVRPAYWPKSKTVTLELVVVERAPLELCGHKKACPFLAVN